MEETHPILKVLQDKPQSQITFPKIEETEQSLTEINAKMTDFIQKQENVKTLTNKLTEAVNRACEQLDYLEDLEKRILLLLEKRLEKLGA